jgi:hypothetical protein
MLLHQHYPHFFMHSEDKAMVNTGKNLQSV